MEKLIFEGVRCFRIYQECPVKPLTLLVGENSSGKNTFLVLSRIALARVNGARVLCSEDGALWTDFKNQRLINKPRGRIYRTAQHARLLCHTKAYRRKMGP